MVTATLSAAKDRIATLTAGGVKVTFGDEPIWLWKAWDANGGGVGVQGENAVDLVPALYNAPSVTENADGFLATWAHAVFGGVALQATHDHDLQCARLRMVTTVPNSAPPAGLLGVYSIHRTQLRFRVPAFGSPENMYLATGCRGGESIRNPSSIEDEMCLGVPGGIVFNEAGDVASQDQGSLPYVYLWDDVLERGLMIRIRDSQPRGKLIRYQGDPETGEVIIAIEMYPPGRRSLSDAGDSMAFGPDFDIELRPMKGSDWHAAAWHAAMLRSENHSAVARATFGSGGNGAPDAVRNARAMLIGQAQTNDATNYDVFREDMRRLSAYFGSTDLLAYFARVDTGAHGPFPGGIPVSSGQHDACAGVVADGTGMLGSYTYPDIVYLAGSFYSASSPALSGLVVKDHTGAILVMGSPYSGHAIVNLGHDGARSQMFDYWKALANSGNYPALRALYADMVGSQGAKDDFGSNVPAARRGAGDTYSIDGDIKYLAEARALLRSLNESNFTIGEFLNEHKVRHVDIIGGPAFTQPNPYRRWMNYGRVVLGSRVRGMDWDSYGPNNLDVVEDPMAYVAMIQFCRGQMLSLYHPLPGPPLIPAEGESNYDFWTVAKDRFALYKLCFFTAADILRPYDEGLLGPPLPGSHEEDIRRNGYGLDQYLLPRPTLGVAAAVNFARIGGKVSGMVRVVNHRTTAQKFTVDMRSDRYPWIAGKHEVYEVDPTTAEESLVETIDGTFTFDVDVEPRPSNAALRLFRIAECVPCEWKVEL